jgi:hypothetical protein
MAISAERKYKTYIIVYKEEGIILVYRSSIRVYALIKIKLVARLMGTCNNAKREV